MVEFKDSRIALYNGKNAISVAQQTGDVETGDAIPNLGNPLELYMQRQPTLRVMWEPDVLRLSPRLAAPLRKYVVDFVEKQHPDVRDDESLAVIGGLLSLAGHKNPRMRVLELGGDAEGYKAKLWQSMLGKHTAFSQVASWHAGTLSEKGEISLPDGVEGPFDVVLIPKVSSDL